MLLNENSLAKTLDNVNDMLFWNKQINDAERLTVSQWIADRFGKPGAYRGLFAPTNFDYLEGIRLFTGEKIATKAGTAHILSEEAGRVLLLVGSEINENVRQTLLDMFGSSDQVDQPRGDWCCGTCTSALWRHLAAGGGDRQEERMINGLKSMRSFRTDNNRWRRYPFYYTILALTEMDVAPARTELRFAAPAIERALSRLGERDMYEKRRKELLKRALDLI